MSQSNSNASGLTLYACFGPYGGFKVEVRAIMGRVILGWLAFGYIRRDVEMLLIGASTQVTQLRERVRELEAARVTPESETP